MALSYTIDAPLAPAERDGVGRRKVLVTGAAGRIGSYFAEQNRDTYELRLMVRGDEPNLESIAGFGEVVTGDLSDFPFLKKACEGIDTIVHMAGDPDPTAVWADLLAANIVGTYNIFVAARNAGCRRVIHASSIHAVSGYPADVQVKTTDPVNPGDLYGVSKCFGEALARYMAEKEGVSSVTIRIGAFQPEEVASDAKSLSMMDAYVSHRDLDQLICRCIEADGLRFAVFHGVSNNRFKRLDISDAREIVGFAPEDNVAAANPRLKPLELDKTVQTHSAISDGAPSGLRNDVVQDAKERAGA